MCTDPASDDGPCTPREHFSWVRLAAVARVLDRAADALGSDEALDREFPFLTSWHEELLRRGFDTPQDASRAILHHRLEPLEARAPGHLPLAALRAAAGLDPEDLALLVVAGLVEEDARFGSLFSALQGAPHLHHPTAGLLDSWWSAGAADGHGRLRRLLRLGLLEAGGTDGPRSERWVHVPAPIWDALRGEADDAIAPWALHVPLAALEGAGPVVLPATAAAWLEPLPRLVGLRVVDAVVVRGPRHGGRRTVLRGLARALGRGTLEVDAPAAVDDGRWRLVGPLATLLHALPILRLETGAGESSEVPALDGSDVATGIIAGRQGGITGAGVERAVTVELATPTPAERREHWRIALGPEQPALDELAARFRMASGQIRRAAALARSHAALNGRAAATVDDVAAARRMVQRQALESLATPLAATGDFADLAASADTLRELRHLEERCRRREELAGAVGPALARTLNPGVRALLQGPSGTGKTLAARVLAGALRMDLWRVDLSAVVNKYIGETEKNLSRVFSAAEELDVILLLDEGDALLARRTQVANANDRYANLETNYLLQRIESYEGILLVTTNAAELVDGAFQRRMDVVIGFRPPDPAERWAIWQLHLPAANAVDPGLLREVAARCPLSGGQIRNAVLHAAVLALSDGGTVRSEHLEAAVEREYRKSGGSCPLRAGLRS
ncbi:MAG TPA: ATP-binding protein [Anaeromyxobacter sp.]|nr:ATP-binding protein [Anaeromyxobacter sp.]